jgi:hypothetical protein
VTPLVPMCVYCSRLIRETFSCDAFPDGIPGALTIGHADHRAALPGDEGIRFRPRDERAKEAVIEGWGAEPVPYEGDLDPEDPSEISL